MSRLKHLLRLNYGDALAADKREEGEIPVFGSNGPVGTHSVANTSAPTILVGRKGSFGKVVWSDLPGFCIDTAYYVDERSCAGDLRFSFYALQSLGLDTTSRDTGVPGLSREDAHDRRLAIPSREEQTAIARFLDRETSRIDGLIEKKGRFIELLKEKRAALITHAVTKGIDAGVPMKDSGVDWIGQVPTHWKTPRIATLFREAFRPADPSLPVLSVSIHNGVTDGELSDDERDRKVSLSEDRTKYQGVEPGDLVYNMMRAWQGAFGAVSVKGLVSPAYVVARPINQFRTKFIEHLLHTKSASEEIRRFSKGIADFRMRLYWEHFRALRVALPPLDEQDRILAEIHRETGRIDGLIAKTDRSIELLKEKRSALITAAVTGKIDVRTAT
ncbi:restriction endonuclease subunit S [Paracoccus pantotrophus]|uniref:restriction endonuclease subunit S n=1 Tax=Paracoccus pantotrophus TaxID=82367 RepID=UPI0009DD5D56|nr:restriction endonuclease subunit S [Paracoccus pantotrophus]